MTATPVTATRTAVEVVFRAERDVASWEARHARGEVPGRWPYGLDLLARTGATVTTANLPEPTRADRVRALLRSAVPHPGRSRHDVGIAWDENLARRMLVLSPHARMYAGAIWLTDALEIDPSSERVRGALDVLRRMDGVFVNSSAQVEPLQAALGRSGPPVSFFTFGVDHEFFSAQPPAPAPLVVSVGGDRDRDPTTLFAALSRVHEARPDVEIVVQNASDVPAPPGVTKVPRLSHTELRDLYARASVVAIATRPNLHMSGLTVSLESMATARPVVLTATPGHEDYHRDGETALLVEPQEPTDLADRVLDLLDDPDAAIALGQRARQAVEDRFTSAHLVDGMARAVGLV
ncbi:glycosyltransferase family 4 protein [Cellulomonas fimi]|uniref:glycosyltransferase family 4 protein n=1 Tax=Cellulomonas fimi TaxID=1708 RepID=UPI00235A2092|nr:glycosyltransferase family 4 protein [Cellulomonas fimi]